MNKDLFEDESIVINRLFYVVSSIHKDTIRCFLFCVDSTFKKDKMEDLILLDEQFIVLT